MPATWLYRVALILFLAAQVAGAVLSFLYFGPPAMLLSLLVALLVGSAAWLART
jgi:hypothetical protein